MRKKWHAAAVAAGTGLIALGGAMTAGGAAHAAQSANGARGVGVTSCNSSGSGVRAGVMQSCTSSGTVRYPERITLTVSGSALAELLNPVVSVALQGLEDDWTMTCYAKNTQILSKSGAFKIKSPADKSINLPLSGQTPSSCKVTSTSKILVGAGTVVTDSLASLTIADKVTADTATVNAVRSGTWCADTTADSDNPGNPVQSWNCLSDHAQRWAYAPNRELVHEGRCLGYTAGGAVLKACTGAPDQIWYSYGRNRQLKSAAGGCLGVAHYRNRAQLRVYRCNSKSYEKWLIPAMSSY